MKIYQKILSFSLFLLCIMLFLGCKEKNNAESVANGLILNVNFADNLEVDSDFILPNKVIYNEYECLLTWESHKTDIISIDTSTEIKALVNEVKKDTKVTLTCYLNYEGEKRERDFTVLVKVKLPEYRLEDLDLILEDDVLLCDTMLKDEKEVKLSYTSSDSSLVKIEDNKLVLSPDIYTKECQISQSYIYDGKKYSQSYDFYVLGSSFSFVLEDDEAYDPLLDVLVLEDNIYNQKLEVALYIVAFNKLPSNYRKKSEFNKNDYTSENLLSTGGDVFGNREGLLPKDDNYYECDINYTGGGRNALRLVYSLDSLSVYYTSDHYLSFDYIYKDGTSLGSIYVR